MELESTDIRQHTVEALTHFASLNFQCPSMANPMDFFIDNITIDNRSEAKVAESRKRLAIFVEEWKLRGDSNNQTRSHLQLEVVTNEGEESQPSNLKKMRAKLESQWSSWKIESQEARDYVSFQLVSSQTPQQS